jgi:hypothetical protein
MKLIKRRGKWISYVDAERLLGVSMDELNHLVHDTHIRRQPWYRRPFSLTQLRRDDVERLAKTRLHPGT